MPSTSTLAAALCSLLLIYVSLGLVPLHAASSGAGFSIELIHRDHPKSPLYDPYSTPFERTMAAARRSMIRAQRIADQQLAASSPNFYRPEITPDDGEYLMKYELGTPPLERHGVFQTASGVTWTNCIPCPTCDSQVPPLFNPNESYTYKTVSCSSPLCNTLKRGECSDPNFCPFKYTYDDLSYVQGLLAWEKFTVSTTEGGKFAMLDVAFGCITKIEGSFNSMATGIVSFSPSPLSFVSQLGNEVGWKFSYCFPPFSMPNVTTTLKFGEDVVYPDNAVITPLFPNHVFHIVKLVNIIVGNKTIEVPQLDSEEGNMRLDSASTLTLLDPTVLQQVISEVTRLIKSANGSNPVATDKYSTCFVDAGPPSTNYPVITFVFSDEAKVQLRPANSFVKPEPSLVCLAMGERLLVWNVLGNIAQQNMLTIVDVGQMKIAFTPVQC